VAKHFDRIAGVGRGVAPLHNDAARLRECDGRSPLGRRRADPFAKPSVIRRDRDDDALRRPCEPRKRVAPDG
jgi:hypothetical protein